MSSLRTSGLIFLLLLSCSKQVPGVDSATKTQVVANPVEDRISLRFWGHENAPRLTPENQAAFNLLGLPGSPSKARSPKARPEDAQSPRAGAVDFATIHGIIARKLETDGYGWTGTLPGISDHTGKPITTLESFGYSGGLNAGVFKIAIGDRPHVIVRFEQVVAPTAAQNAAQLAIKGKGLAGLFAQVYETEDFVGHDGRALSGQLMQLGGTDLRAGGLTRLQAADILRACLAATAAGMINADSKSSNFVRTLDRDGAMMIDHGSMRVVRLMTEDEDLGPMTFLLPEAIEGSLAKTKQKLAALVKQAGPEGAEALAAANTWYLGHTIYNAITADSLSTKKDLRWSVPYPSASDIRAKIAGAASYPPYAWLRGHEDALASLLHPDPKQRGSAGDLLRALLHDSGSSAETVETKLAVGFR